MENLPDRDVLMNTLRAFKQRRADYYGLTDIGFFGSVARGQAGGGSDIDIVFRTRQPNLFLTAHMRQELEELFGRHVDVIRLRSRMNPELKKEIQRDACFV